MKGQKGRCLGLIPERLTVVTDVRFRQAWSAMDLLEATQDGESADRDQEQYRVEGLIDVDPSHHAGAYLVESDTLVFGWELLRRVHLRELNFGRLGDTDTGLDVGGKHIAQEGFRTCRDCGKVQRPGHELEHAPYCRVRTRHAEERVERVFLARDMLSEAIRVLLPLATRGSGELLPSVTAAFRLGLRRTYPGQASHLLLTMASEPADGHTRRTFLVVVDAVPGGTGYVADLAQPARFFEVIQRGLEAMRGCRCAGDADRDGCYRCVYSHAQARQQKKISRRAAVALFERILAARDAVHPAATLSRVNVGSVVESELEELLIERLAERAQKSPGSSLTEHWVNGRKGWRLTLVGPHATQTWRIEPQHPLGRADGVAECRPDFVLWPVQNAEAPPVAVFCDGLRYHAPPDAPRGIVSSDFSKRQSLLESGRFRVWSLTWKDLEEEAPGQGLFGEPRPKSEHTLRGKLLSDLDEGSVPERGGVKRGSFALLLEYLRAPSDVRWQRAIVASLLASLSLREMSAEGATAQRRRLLSAAPRSELAAPPESVPGGAWVGARHDLPWASLLVALPREAVSAIRPGELRLTLRLFDEAPARAAEGFEASWRAALHALNVLQFAAGAWDLVTTERLEREDAPEPVLLGELLRGDRVPAAAARSTRPPPDVPPEASELMTEYPQAADHLRAVAQAALPPPAPFDGLTERGRVLTDALLAWRDARVAWVFAATDADRETWAAHGWSVIDLASEPPENAVARARTALEGAP